VRTVVLDASVLVACLFKDGRARSVLLDAEDVVFLTPPGILREADRQLARVADRTGASKAEVQDILALLRDHIQEVALEVLLPWERRAKRIATEGGDPEDWEYVALALASAAPIWTYDADFRRMRGIRVLGTVEVAGSVRPQRN
jgi:predicted nucleic acid-binding protein